MHPEEIEKNLLLFHIFYCFFAIKVYNISIKRTEDKTMTNEEQMMKAVFALNILQSVLTDHGTALTQTEVNNLLHGITKTLVEITKK